jgi:hypothetical protein
MASLLQGTHRGVIKEGEKNADASTGKLGKGRTEEDRGLSCSVMVSAQADMDRFEYEKSICSCK